MRDIEAVMSTPVESDKRDRERVGLHNESSSMEVACGRDGEKERGRDRLKYSNGEYRKQQRRIRSQRTVCIMSISGDC